MIWNTLYDNLPYLLHGTWIALQLLAGLLAIGLVLGLALALVEVYGGRLARVCGIVFERVFRGIPAVVLLLLSYYGVSDFIEIPPFLAAVLALGLRSTAYQSQIFRGAIQAVPVGQMMAARALGMGRVEAIFRIVIPQAMRHAIGPWTNDFSSELKATSLAYVIGVIELTRQAKYIISSTQGNILIVFGVVAIIYFIINRLGNIALYRLEARMTVPGFERRRA